MHLGHCSSYSEYVHTKLVPPSTKPRVLLNIPQISFETNPSMFPKLNTVESCFSAGIEQSVLE